MAEPVELTQKIKELYHNELAVVTYIGTSREGDPVYMLSEAPLDSMKSCFMGSPWFLFVNTEDIKHSKLLQWPDRNFYYIPDPDLEIDPITGKKPCCISDSAPL